MLKTTALKKQPSKMRAHIRQTKMILGYLRFRTDLVVQENYQEKEASRNPEADLVVLEKEAIRNPEVDLVVQEKTLEREALRNPGADLSVLLEYLMNEEHPNQDYITRGPLRPRVWKESIDQ